MPGLVCMSNDVMDAALKKGRWQIASIYLHIAYLAHYTDEPTVDQGIPIKKGQCLRSISQLRIECPYAKRRYYSRGRIARAVSFLESIGAFTTEKTTKGLLFTMPDDWLEAMEEANPPTTDPPHSFHWTPTNPTTH